MMDGSHIKGLVINFLHNFWPSLLSQVPKFLQQFITPIMKASHTIRNTVVPVYSIHDYETWRKEPANEADSYRVKYYKGLGTHSRDEVQEYFRNLDYHVKEFVWEGDKDGKAILLAFSKGKTAAENRRDWLQPEKNLAGLEPEENLFIDPSQKTIPYTDFLNKEYIHCARAHNQRSIPSVVDGLKPCQRKILFSAFNKPLDEEMKVDQLCGYVSENSAYHHGIDSVEGAIVRMAQDFIGTNNIPLLYPGGQFGTRKMGGLDHADGRYICTKLSPITRLIFQKADEPLLDYLNEDGQSIEPKWYFPIIPMILVNGCKGIGTGWKTSVPCFNPFEIIESLKLLIKDKELTDELVPWYKGFNGTIEVAKHSKSHCDIKIH